jgi:hypothetical protein
MINNDKTGNMKIKLTEPILRNDRGQYNRLQSEKPFGRPGIDVGVSEI